MTGSNHIIKSKVHILNPSFTKSEQKVVQILLQTRADVMYFFVTELASTAAIREATVLPFCRRLGCTGYQECQLPLLNV